MSDTEKPKRPKIKNADLSLRIPAFIKAGFKLLGGTPWFEEQVKKCLREREEK